MHQIVPLSVEIITSRKLIQKKVDVQILRFGLFNVLLDLFPLVNYSDLDLITGTHVLLDHLFLILILFTDTLKYL